MFSLYQRTITSDNALVCSIVSSSYFSDNSIIFAKWKKSLPTQSSQDLFFFFSIFFLFRCYMDVQLCMSDIKIIQFNSNQCFHIHVDIIVCDCETIQPFLCYGCCEQKVSSFHCDLNACFTGQQFCTRDRSRSRNKQAWESAQCLQPTCPYRVIASPSLCGRNCKNLILRSRFVHKREFLKHYANNFGIMYFTYFIKSNHLISQA